jgi:NADH dehydrogenase FAD-containing subunit
MKNRIIIVGGGFAGLELVTRLSGNENFEVVVVDRNNYHFFPPLLYQVSTAFIEPSNISYPFRKMFQRKKNIRSIPKAIRLIRAMVICIMITSYWQWVQKAIFSETKA